MKLGIAKSSRKATRHTSGGKSSAFAPKVMCKSKKGKKLMYAEGGISKLDAQVIVGLVKEPFHPNEATMEARELGKSIRRI